MCAYMCTCVRLCDNINMRVYVCVGMDVCASERVGVYVHIVIAVDCFLLSLLVVGCCCWFSLYKIIL